MKKRALGNTENRLWQYSATATGILLICAFAIATTFFVIHQRQLNQSLAHSELVNTVLFKDLNTLEPWSNERLTQRANVLMEIDDYLSITLIDENKTKLFEAGLPLNDTDLTPPTQGLLRWSHDERLFVAQEIHNSASPKAWLITTIDKTHISLIKLQFLFVTSLILFGISIFTVIYHRKLNNDIFIPLEKLNDMLSKQNKMRDMSPITLNNKGILEELIQQTNETFAIQTEKEMDFRGNIEHTAQELRESLETVEIHNIDLDMSRKNAIELNKLKSDFLKKTSQDLRNPLNGILGFSDLLQKTPLSIEQKDYITTIEESTKGMLTIVNDIHDFSRLEGGNFFVDKKAMEIRSNIEETLTLQAPIANERSIKLYSTVDQGIPINVLGDSIRIQQVIANLISNAIKFDNTTYIEVCVSAINISNYDIDLSIKVNTDGNCPYEFENWQLLNEDNNNTSKQFYSGAGMGLSIAKGIAQHMQGEISFENTETTCSFVFTLTLDIDLSTQNNIKTIDPSYQINALVFSNSDLGYREVTSRLIEIGIRNQRARGFSDILTIAQKLKDESLKHARYMPIAVIEAQTSQQTLDKIVLTQTLRTIIEELEIPTVVITSMGKHESLQKVLKGIDVSIVQHPLVTTKFRKNILEQLGIIKWKYEPTPQRKTTHSKAIQILVVDDNPANLKLATALLSDFHADITTASTGTEAINEFQKTHFDLIFMDIQLPDFDGFEATTKIRKIESNDKRTPIIALTAHNVAEEKTRLLLAGMDDFVGKPLTIKDIGKIIDRWVINKQAHKSKAIQKKIKYSNQSKKMHTEDSTLPLHSQDASPVNISDCLALTRNDPSLAKEMLSMLLQSIRDDLKHIESAFKDGDNKKLYEKIHNLHGACCYCGVPRLKNVVKNLDSQLLNNEVDDLKNNLLELNHASQELITWSENHDINALFELAD